MELHKRRKALTEPETRYFMQQVPENRRMIRNRCYDFLNVFAEKFSKQIGVFDSKKLNYAKF
jgi:hypothetical protein